MSMFSGYLNVYTPVTGYEGSGIGLSICERVVDLYGGAIWVVSTRVRGGKRVPV